VVTSYSDATIENKRIETISNFDKFNGLEVEDVWSAGKYRKIVQAMKMIQLSFYQTRELLKKWFW